MASVTITIKESNAEADNAFCSTIDKSGNGNTFRRQMSSTGELPAERRIAHWTEMESSIFEVAKRVLGTETQEDTIGLLIHRDGWNVYIDVDPYDVMRAEGMKFINYEDLI